MAGDYARAETLHTRIYRDLDKDGNPRLMTPDDFARIETEVKNWTEDMRNSGLLPEPKSGGD